MATQLIVHPGVDSAFLAWRAPFIPNCRGFSLWRKVKRVAGSAASPNAKGSADNEGFIEECVASWVGFAGGPEVPPGTRMPTTQWPIQKYLWSDFMVGPGDQVAYRVIPMLGAAVHLQAAEDLASDWSPRVTIGAETSGHASCYFNRGIVASQWLSRLLPAEQPSTTLAKDIAEPGNTVRNFLAGPIRDKLVELLTTVKGNKGHVYAALFELDDPELIPLVQALGRRAHIVLGNGSVKHKGEDENADAREALSHCDVKDRMSAPRALAHNKFMVICDAENEPQMIWTGSTNWTKTGLCTQANNALLVRDKTLAALYLKQWQALADAGDATPPELMQANALAREVPRRHTTLWFTPMHGGQDLEQAGALIAKAQEGILFLMFNPGPRGTLLNDIIELASPASPSYKPDLYIQGVVNQNPGTDKNPVTLFNRGDRIDANQDVVLPAAIPGHLEYWQKELKQLPGTHAMVHSKVVIIDPYGANPVVITGSHNMGPKASSVNDENLIIIQGNRDLASQYAGKIMEIYSQYRWRQSVQAQNRPNAQDQVQNDQAQNDQAQRSQAKWQGLADDDHWQIKDETQPYDKRRIRELNFWFGRSVANP